MIRTTDSEFDFMVPATVAAKPAATGKRLKAPARAGGGAVAPATAAESSASLRAGSAAGAASAATPNKSAVRSVDTKRRLTAHRDTADFRDQEYRPTLLDVPMHRTLADYARGTARHRIPVLDQGREGACTGFALATVVQYLLCSRQVVPCGDQVSAQMLYHMARRYDEWPGDAYEGSSARGAMKGWHQHGVCRESSWANRPPRRGQPRPGLSPQMLDEATNYVLGAYYRVQPDNLVQMHCALTEAGILFATGAVHQGWQAPDPVTGRIAFEVDPEQRPISTGGHAFAIVGFDTEGFWIQNSWGEAYGVGIEVDGKQIYKGGFCHISYDDWLLNGWDVWVARLGVAHHLRLAASVTRVQGAAGAPRPETIAELRPHVVSLGNDGALKPSGPYATTLADLDHLFGRNGTAEPDADGKPTTFFHRVTQAPAFKAKRRVLLYAHGGLVGEESALQTLARHRPELLRNGIYPLFFIWHSGFRETLGHIIEDAVGARTSAGRAADFFDFTTDPLIEFGARYPGGLVWEQMKANAQQATTQHLGGAQLVANKLRQLADQDPDLEVHLVGHSAGAIMLGPLAAKLAALKLPIKSLTLWAPACTVPFFEQHYAPLIKDDAIEEVAIYTLTDKYERDDDCFVYRKSLLYLVSRSFEPRPALLPAKGHPAVLGIARYLDPLEAAKYLPKAALTPALLTGDRIRCYQAPNTDDLDKYARSSAAQHGAFDNDNDTLRSTWGRIAGVPGSQIRPVYT